MRTRTGIREARRSRGLSQEHLALAAGVSLRTVSRAETGLRIGGESLRCLHAALDLGDPWRPGSAGPSQEARMVVAGWLPGCPSREAALDHAASYARRHLDTERPLHVAALPFRDGYVWEAREDGPCVGHLPAIVEALSGGRTGWLPVRDRVLHVSMRDGRPSLLMLPAGLSDAVKAEDPHLLEATGAMHTLAA